MTKEPLNRIWARLVEPSADVRTSEDRYRAQLLAALFAIVTPLGLVAAAAPTLHAGNPPWYSSETKIMIVTMILVSIGYAVSRTQYYAVVAKLSIIGASAAIFISAIPDDSPDDLMALFFLVIPVLLSSVFLSFAATIIVAIANAAGVLLMPLVIADVSYNETIINAFAAAVILSTVVLLSTHFWRLLETRRQFELAESEARYRGLFEATFEGMAFHENGALLEANPGFAQMLGYTREEMVGMAIFDFVTEESRDLIAGNIESYRPFEVIGLKRNGAKLPIEMVSRSQSYRGQVAQVVAIRDITALKQIETELRKFNQVLEQRVAERTAEISRVNEELIHELAEREQAEQALRESEERFRAIYEFSPIGITIVNAEGKFVRTNRAYQEMLGYTKDELQGKPTVAITHPQDAAEGLRQVKEMAAGRGNHYRREKRYLHKDGRIVWASISTAAVYDATGVFKYAFGMMEDITERKQSEDALRESEARYRQLFEYAPAGIYELDMVRVQFISVNDVMCLYTGYTREEFLALDPLDVLTEEGKRLFIERMERIKSGQQVSDTAEYQIRSKTGREFWVLINSRLTVENGRPVRATVVAHNITERREVEEALKASEERFKRLFEYAPDAYYMNDLKGNFVDGNRAAEEMLGYKKEELVGKNMLKLKLLPPKYLPKVAKALSKNMLGQTTGPDEFVINRKDGSQVTVEISTIPVKIKGQTRVLGIARDITRRKWAEDALQKAYDELEERVKERTTELSTMLDVTRAVSSTLDLEEVLALIAEQMVQATAMSGCTISRWEREADAIVTWSEYYTDPNLYDTPGVRYALDNFPATRRALETRQPLSVRVSDPQVDPVESAYLQEVGSASSLLLPMTVGDRVAGLVELYQVEFEREFTASEIRLCQTLANQAAVAVENARLYNQAQQEIIARQQAERRIKASLKEKEVLLREIHHRVKNNLQVISSLLNLQARQIEDGQMLEVLAESQNRVRSMALVHEKLYQSPDLAGVDFAAYVRSLTHHLFRTYTAGAKAVKLKMDIQDVALNIDAATPCGLILNELISNALKHAFPFPSTERENEIAVGLRAKQGRFILVVRDNGIGFPTGLDPHNTESLGLQLVTTLVEQLDGSLEVTNGSGTEFQITFAEPQYRKRI